MGVGTLTNGSPKVPGGSGLLWICTETQTVPGDGLQRLQLASVAPTPLPSHVVIVPCWGGDDFAFVLVVETWGVNTQAGRPGSKHRWPLNPLASPSILP